MAANSTFAVMNSMEYTSNSVAYTNGNLSISPSTSWSTTTWARSSLLVPKDKKIYVEAHLTSGAGNLAAVGFAANESPPTGTNVGGTGSVTIYNAAKYVNGTLTNSAQSTVSQGSIYQVAIDGSNNKVWIGVDNTWSGSGDPASGTNEAGTITTNSTVGYDITFVAAQNSSSTLTMNFGQDSSFAGNKSTGTANAADGNGIGEYYYAPPTGFVGLCSSNMTTDSNVSPSETDNDHPVKNFNVVTYTGNGTSQSITGVGFAPDLVWLKERDDGAQSSKLLDTTRGATYAIEADSTQNTTSAETNGLTAFGTDGFTVGSDAAYNANTDTYVAWCWRANGGTTSTNTDGTITSTIQANTAAGFSIVKWTSNNSANQTIGHGLGKAPRFILSKPYSASTWSWHVFHHYLGAIGHFGLNQTTASAFTSSTNTYGAMPGSSVFTVGTAGNLMPNNSTTDVISYCWADVEGQQKFDVYKANAQTNGPFIYTGFRPRLVFVKKGSGSGHWTVGDSARGGENGDSPLSNQIRKVIDWNRGDYGEYGTGTRDMGFYSNGFKIQTSDGELNSSGQTYIYGAWADVPAEFSQAF